MDQKKFMIRVAHGVPIDLMGYIFTIIRSDASYITTDILPFGILITQFLLHAGLLPDIAECVRELIGPINSFTLSQSTGHQRLCLHPSIPEQVDTQEDGHPTYYGVSTSETSTQAKASRTATRDETADKKQALIHAQTLQV